MFIYGVSWKKEVIEMYMPYCTKCENELTYPTKKGPDSFQGKAYDWARYHCTKDDVWIDVWEPQEEDES